MRQLLLVLALASVPACQSSRFPQAPDFSLAGIGDYQITDLGSLAPPDSISCRGSEARAVNGRGQVVGWSRTGSSVWVCPTHAFLWEDGVMTDLGTLGGWGRNSFATHINGRGQVAGYSWIDAETFHAFLWEAGAMQDLGTLGGNSSTPAGLGPAGDVVGSSHTATGESHAFLWRDGAMQDLGTLGGTYSAAFDLNSLGQIVGRSLTAAGEMHAFLWENGVMQDLGTLGGASSTAVAINDAGAVTGNSTDGAGRTRAFVWMAGAMQDLGGAFADNATSQGVDVNVLGQVMGLVTDSLGTRPFLWTAGATLQVMDNFGWPVTTPVALNSGGQIAGQSRYCSSVTCTWAFVWRYGAMNNLGALPGNFRSVARDMNDRGDVVGFSAASSERFSAVLWRRQGADVVQLPLIRPR